MPHYPKTQNTAIARNELGKTDRSKQSEMQHRVKSKKRGVNLYKKHLNLQGAKQPPAPVTQIQRIYRRDIICRSRRWRGRTTKTGGRKSYYLEGLERGDGSLEGRRDHGGGVSLLLLLHQVLASKLQGNSETELGGLLEQQVRHEVAEQGIQISCLP
jgi:hypothetical protein